MRDLKIYLIIASGLLLVYLVAQYNRPKQIDWTETFINTDKIPFGTYILYDRLSDIYPRATINACQKSPYEVIATDKLNNSTYIIISSTVNFNEDDYGQLLKYVVKGNNVFIAAANFGPVMLKELKVHATSELLTNGQTYVNFVNKGLGDSSYVFEHKITENYFNGFDTSKTVILGKNGYDHASYIKIHVGKGALYLNANPLLFTNYSLLQNKGADYAAKALSYLKIQNAVAWDEYYSQGREGGDSSMQVFLRHKPLRWAFYLVFFSLFIFVVYQSKRRQRVIPIIEPVTNTSVEFVSVVGQVYFEQHNNSNIAQKKASYFLDHIRTRYNLNTGIQDTAFMQALAKKSGVDIALINDIFYSLALIQHGEPVSNNELVSFNQKIEQFYTRSS